MDFADAWGRYLPASSPIPETLSVTTVTTRVDIDDSAVFHTVTPGLVVTDEKCVSTNKDAGCHCVTDQIQGMGEKGGNGAGSKASWFDRPRCPGCGGLFGEKYLADHQLVCKPYLRRQQGNGGAVA